MRVVGGSAKGKTLLVVPGDGTRPILDRVRTALFDILRPYIQDVILLDLFAGSGSVGIEALSQGAAHCTFIDLGHKAIATIKKNLAIVGFANRAAVRQGDALGFLRETDKTFDLIYIAPPQYKGLWEQALRLLDERPALLRRPDDGSTGEPGEGLAIVQIDPKEYKSLDLMTLQETRQKRYGNTLLIFFEPSHPAADGENAEEQVVTPLLT